jgi:hypothetical protein
MHRSQIQAEAEATPSNTVRNRLLAPSLSDLLDERKAVQSTEDLQALANKYAIDMAKLESVAQFVHSPSVEEGSHQKEINAEGEEIITMRVSFTSNTTVNLTLMAVCSRLLG